MVVDLQDLGRYYRSYARLMAHWRRVLPPGRMLEVRYEDVIADLETRGTPTGRALWARMERCLSRVP